MSEWRKMTHDPIIWFQYGAWHIQIWMYKHKPVLPRAWRHWVWTHYGDERFQASHRHIQYWREHNIPYSPSCRPLPWPICQYALGPFYGPWMWAKRQIRKCTGGRSHRCEFTDPEHGALYGHRKGAFMDVLFEGFSDSVD